MILFSTSYKLNGTNIQYNLLLACWLLLLTACTVGPVYHPPEEKLPAHYRNVNKNYSSAIPRLFWWNMLGDPLLVELINQAVCGKNLDVVKASANVRQARAALGIAKADLYPQLDGNGKISRDHLSHNSEIISSFPAQIIPLYYTDYKFGFDASWEFDFFGRVRHSIEASRAQFESAIENQHVVVLSTAAEVARDYILYRVYQRRIAIARHSINSYAHTAKLTAIQLHAGLATVADLHRVKSQWYGAVASLPTLKAEAQATLNALAVMVGEYPETLSKKLTAVAPIPVFQSAKLSIGLPSDLLLTRPDVRSAERELAAATANVGVAVANQFPRFQLIGDIGSETVFPGQFFQSASYYWSIAPQVSIPIFHGGRLRYAVKENVAVRDAAFATYKQTILQALSDVESALIRYQNQQAAEKNLLVSYNKEYAAMRLVKIQYQVGQIALLDLLDVERQVDQISDQHVQAVGQVAINLITLYKALGGAWV